MNLVSFVSKFTTNKGHLARRTCEVIVRTFLQLSSNPRSKTYGQYCKHQLIKYKPWSNSIANAWNNCPNTDEDYIHAYQQFLATPNISNYIPNFVNELQNATYQQKVDEDEESPEPPNDEHSEEWMMLCHLNQQFSNSVNTEDTYDWCQAAQVLPPELLRACPSWVHDQQQQTTTTMTRCLPTIDIQTLNANQKKAYNIVKKHYDQHISNQKPQQLLMLICGTAGTGKSYLISALANLLGNTCLLTGTTGMAAYNICGKTLHSTIQIPINNTVTDLQGNSLRRLQQTFENKLYLLLDEMSMMGQRMMTTMDKRLRQATAQLDVPMGGMSVILIGDFAQLPPVCDRPLYATNPTTASQTHGYTMYQLFNKVAILDQVLRQSGNDTSTITFRELLLRLRSGQTTTDDWQTLLTRSAHTVADQTEFSNSLRLFYDKKSVTEYNHSKLTELGSPIAQLKALHSGQGASASPNDAGGLQPILFLARGARVMLTMNIWQQVGLCNGSAGTVQDILYRANTKPPDLPIAVLVTFDSYTGPPFLSDNPNCVPIAPTCFEWSSNSNRNSRQQVPLQLRYAITIHKSQGQTLSSAVIDIGRKELASGCTLVALSRVRRLDHMLIQPMSWQRIQATSNGRNFQARCDEEQRLQQLSIHS